MKRVLILIFIFGMFLSCQQNEKTKASTPAKEVIEEHVFANYYIRYLESVKLFKAEASFFEGKNASNAKPIAFEGGLSFVNSGMDTKKINDKIIRYQYNNRMDYPKIDFDFKHKDKNGKAHLYSIGMLPLVDFEILEASLSKGIKIELNSSPLSSTETVVVLLTDINGTTASLDIKGPTESSLLSGDLAMHKELLSLGKLIVSVVRKKTEKGEDGRYENVGTIELYSKEKETEMRE